MAKGERNWRNRLTTDRGRYCDAWCYYTKTRAEVYVRPLNAAGDPILCSPVKVLVPLKPPTERRVEMKRK